VRKALLALALFASMHLSSQSVEGQVLTIYDPNPNAEAVVSAGRARFTILTPRLIRIQYSQDRRFEDRATFAVVNRRLPVPNYSVSNDGEYTIISTEALTLRYRNNAPITSSSTSAALQVTFKMGNEVVEWNPCKEDTMNLLGTTRTLDGALGDSKLKEMEKGILSRGGWTLLDESPNAKRGDGSSSLAFDGNVNGFPWVSAPVDKNAVDWYLFAYGHDYLQALRDFTQISGRQSLPPRYIFGYWYSRYWRYTQQDYVSLVTEIQRNKIPIDVMIFDKDWHLPGWTGWTWDRSIIPNPKALIDWMHSRKLHVSLNLHPADGVENYEEHFDKLREDMGLDSNVTRVPWTLEDSIFYKYMFNDILREREKEGVDFWWIDWQQNLVNPRMQGLSETFWCNHVFYNDMKSQYPNRRPVIFHRWGGMGSHRYPIGFSGDTQIDYSTLNFETWFTPTASNVCFGYWGHDLGGHQRAATDQEPNDPILYLRWMQFGVFTPIFRSHATNDQSIERRIWKYSNFVQLRNAVCLRYKLIPYIYTAARQCFDTGVSICRPLYYYWPEEDEAYSAKSEYLFGDDILVSPVVSAPQTDGLARKVTYLPPGEWWDVSRGEIRSGDDIIDDVYADDEIPYFLKAGSIIPLYEDVYNLSSLPTSITLKVVPGGTNGTGHLYEDDGESQGYLNDECSRTTFSQERDDSLITLTIGATEGSFNDMQEQRDYVVEFLGEKQAPKEVRIEGQDSSTLQWSYDDSSHVLRVEIKTVNVRSETRLLIYRVSGQGTGIDSAEIEQGAKRCWNLKGQLVGDNARGVVIVKQGNKVKKMIK
jgi:alpha-glucosidase (family GH31 glycosyl hydrolase)